MINGWLVIVKVGPFATLPSGFETVMRAVPPVAIKFPATLAVRLVALPNVVGTAVPPKLTLEPDTKPLPVMVNCTPGDPACIEVGEMLVIARSLAIVNVTPPETLASGLVTVIVPVPTPVRRFAGIVAVSEVALPKTVASFVVLKFTTEPETKPDPLTVNCWSGDPLGTLEGEMSVIAGFGGPAAFGVKA